MTLALGSIFMMVRTAFHHVVRPRERRVEALYRYYHSLIIIIEVAQRNGSHRRSREQVLPPSVVKSTRPHADNARPAGPGHL